VLLSVHSSPAKLRWLQLVVEIPLTFGVEKQKHLRVRSDKSDPSTRVNFLATESAKLSPTIQR